MNHQGRRQPLTAKLLELLHRQFIHAGNDHAGQQIDRIPKSVTIRQAPKDGGKRHQNSSGHAAENADGKGPRNPLPQHDARGRDTEDELRDDEPFPAYSRASTGLTIRMTPKLTAVHNSGISKPPQANGRGISGSVGSNTP